MLRKKACRPRKNLHRKRDYAMKKIVTIFLYLTTFALFSTFAVDATDELSVNTAVQGQNEILLSTTPLAINSWTDGNYTSREIESNEIGTLTPIGYINVKTNNRAGYDLVITATPLMSDSFRIDYALNIGPASYDTSAATNTANTISVTDITGLTVTPYALSILVDSSDYNSQPAGNYVGNVTFNYTAK